MTETICKFVDTDSDEKHTITLSKDVGDWVVCVYAGEDLVKKTGPHKSRGEAVASAIKHAYQLGKNEAYQQRSLNIIRANGGQW